MKNLTLWHISKRDLKLNPEEKNTICYGYEEDISKSGLYICSHNLLITNFEKSGEIKWSKDISDFVSANNSPVNITFLTLPNVLCIGFANGEICSISDTGSNCSLVGACDSGLLNMEWSPDQESVVLVTKDLNMILMSCTFDPIYEVNLLNEEFGEKQFITVGWGKKETQFHGSEGKQAAKVKNEISADDLNAASDNTVKISWRGDANLYVVSFIMNNLRIFKVFDKEGHLQYTSEQQQGLEANLSWRPSGNVIATTQKFPDRYVVAFFEKNGLKHGGFTLPVNSTTQVDDLAWSSDSEILALQCRDTENNTQNVLLFTTGNYHWYLKQILTFPSKQGISKILWDNNFDVANNKELHIVLNDGNFFSYSWIWNIDHSKGKSDDDDAVITVIDGKKIFITGFRQTVVPPPMSALELELDSFVNSIHFAPQKNDTENFNSNSFFVCTAECTLTFYEQTQKFPLQYKMLKTVKLDNYIFPFQYYNWYWLNCNTILCIMVNDYNCYNVIEYHLDFDKIIQKNIESLPAAVARIHHHPTNSEILFFQLINGDIVEYKSTENIKPLDFSFPLPCPKFNVLSIDSDLYFLGLSHKGNFYINDEMIMSNVNSFFVHTHFLLLTTLQHELLCTELEKSGLKSIMECQKNKSILIYKRKIERGAKLVIAVPNDTRTIFQMPRGNLETIQPRPLSLKIIGKYLDLLKYNEAFDLMRKQRINLNLIYDHDPEKFIQNINMFLESVQNNSWLSLFLSDLENVDITKTMYSSSYKERSAVTKDYTAKIQKICDIIRINLMKRSDSDSKILPVLTTYVKKNTIEDLENALLLIKQLKLQESANSKLPVGSDEALKYLLYMVDVNRLFDVALGMYDFDIVLLVSNKSQKDPKEYIPMLNELSEMEENYKKYTINKHLKRFDKAVQCLARCGPDKYEELRIFVKYHSLYREALKIFSPNDGIYKEISDDFGLYLKLKKHYTEAGIIYERAKIVDKAVDCYKDALEWEMAIKLAETWNEERFNCLCWDLITALKEEKRHKEALTILEQFYKDKKEAILYAIESGQYKTALRLCSQYNMDDFKNKHLLPALTEEYKNLLELIATNWNNFIRHRERLCIVRENQSKNPAEVYDPSYFNKDSDLYSDVGSTLASSTSRSSSRTFRSSKNKRKHERKIASLKEGSQYEDIALIMALHSLVTSSFELRLQVKEVNIALSCFDKVKEAFILQTSLERLIKEMKDSFKDIWTNELVIQATNASIASQNIPEGCNVIPQGIASLEPHLRIAPAVPDISWKLNGLN